VGSNDQDSVGDRATDFGVAREANRLLAELLDVSREHRQEWLDARGVHEDLQAHVLRLSELAERDAPDLAPSGALKGALIDRLLDESLPEDALVGRYRIVREIGRGGMSSVYLARLDEDGFSHRVAIKLMRGSAGSPDLPKRFARERRALALLSHPCIAKIIDVGVADDRRPYIVMEYVDGLPVDQYCDLHQLGIRERLQLFIRIAETVAFAHSNLIIHRDIKPSNVLVDVHGCPKLLDFGIAKIVDDSEPDLTATERAPHTPGWASPEQVSGRPVTIGSDVYQLGLLLYVMAAGVLPYDSGGQNALSLGRTITRGRLPLASRRVLLLPGDQADLAAARRGLVSSGALQRVLRGEIDLILARALATEAERRYPSPLLLLDDVQRHLDQRAVSARPDSWTYRLGRVAARNRTAFVLAIALVLGTVTSTAFLTVQSLQLRDALRIAESESAMSAAVLDFMLETFRQADPQRLHGPALTVRDAMDSGSNSLGERFSSRPDIEVRVRGAVGEVYESLGEFDKALQHYQQIDTLIDRLPQGVQEEAQLSTDRAMARLYIRLGRYEDSRALLTALLARTPARALDQRVRLDAMSNLAGVHMGMGAPVDAIAMSRQALSLRRTLDGDFAVTTLRAVSNHASLLAAHASLLAAEGADAAVENLQEALVLLDDVVTRASSILGERDPSTLEYRLHRAKVLSSLGDHARAIAEYRHVLPILGGVLPNDHPMALNSRRHFGVALLESGSLDEALVELGIASAGLEEALGRSHPFWSAARLDEAKALVLVGRTDDALQAVVEALENGVNPVRVTGEQAFAVLMESNELRELLAPVRATPEP